MIGHAAFERRWLARAAAAELAARERHYPAQIASGRIAADAAELDLLAWHAIGELLTTGGSECGATWADITIALADAERRRSAAIEADRTSLTDHRRLDAIRAIARLLREARALARAA